jgi:hypothetical protein
MKTNKCIKCDNKTHQKDNLCVSCRIGLTQMYDELLDLLKKDKKWNLRTFKMSGTR